MKELSIFVDEAGVFGQYKVRDPYYILSFVFHNQEDDISLDLKLFEDNVIKLLVSKLVNLDILKISL